MKSLMLEDLFPSKHSNLLQGQILESVAKEMRLNVMECSKPSFKMSAALVPESPNFGID